MKNVLINILSSVESDGECEKIEFTTTGRMIMHDGVCRLYYDEDDGSGNSTGMIRAEGDSVVIHRSGEAASRLTVTAGKRCVGHYDMGAMGMMVGITGRTVNVNITESSADIFLEYAVDINASPVSVNRVEIKANPA